jgi:hypothetical protein
MTDETGRRSTNLVAQSLETEHHLRLTDFTHEKSINSTAIYLLSLRTDTSLKLEIIMHCPLSHATTKENVEYSRIHFLCL